MSFETEDDVDEDGLVPNDRRQHGDRLLLDDMDDTTEEDIDYSSSPEPGMRLPSTKRVQSPKDSGSKPMERASRKIPILDGMQDCPPGCMPSGPSPPPPGQNASPEDELNLRLKEAAQFFASAFPSAPDDDEAIVISAILHHADSIRASGDIATTTSGASLLIASAGPSSDSLPGMPDGSDPKQPSKPGVVVAAAHLGPNPNGAGPFRPIPGPGSGPGQLAPHRDKDGARLGASDTGARRRGGGGGEADRGQPKERGSDPGAKPTWLGHVTRKGGTEWLDQDPGQGPAQQPHPHRRNDAQSATPDLGARGREAGVGAGAGATRSEPESGPSSPSRRHPVSAGGFIGTAPPPQSTNPIGQLALAGGGASVTNNNHNPPQRNNPPQRRWQNEDAGYLNGPQKAVERSDRRDRVVPVSEGGSLSSPRGTVWPSSVRAGQPDDQLQEFAATIFAVKLPHAIRS